MRKLLLPLLLLAIPAHAQKYLWAGATGAGTGNNWTDAYTSLSTFESNLSRNTTNYVAEGSYGSATFNVAASGSQLIVIRKATTNEHGTSTGWSDAMADGQAIFNSTLNFTTAFWTLDGVYRNENNWWESNSYGFKILHNNQDQNITIGANSIQIRFVMVLAKYAGFSGSDERRCTVDTDSFGGPNWTGLVFHRMYSFGACNVWMIRTTVGAVIEYSAAEGAGGNGANHGEVWNLYFSADNAIIRYNQVRDAYKSAGSGGTAIIAATDGGDGAEIYGNIFWDWQVGDGVIGFIGGDASNFKIFQNTFVLSTEGGGGFQAPNGSANLVQNNLWVSVALPSSSAGSGSTVSHNAYSTASGSGTSAQLNVPTSIFVNYANRDFRLAVNTSAGTTLSAPYDVDMFGTPYNISGTWSRGAFAFVEEGEAEGSGSVATAIPGAGNKMRRRIPR